MSDKGQIREIQSLKKTSHEPGSDGFVLDKDIFSNIFDKDIRRVYFYKKAERLAKALHLIAPAFASSPALRERLDQVALAVVEAATLVPARARPILSRELLTLSSMLGMAEAGGLLSANECRSHRARGPSALAGNSFLRRAAPVLPGGADPGRARQVIDRSARPPLSGARAPCFSRRGPPAPRCAHRLLRQAAPLRRPILKDSLKDTYRTVPLPRDGAMPSSRSCVRKAPPIYGISPESYAM